MSSRQDSWTRGELGHRFGASIPEIRVVRTMARRIAQSVLLFAVLSVVAPWQQSVTGAGRVVAFAPLERRQVIESPLTARVVRWRVAEGSLVKAGDPIVELRDNDPELIQRLESERAAKEAQKRSYEMQAESLDSRIGAVVAGGREQVLSAEARLRVGENAYKTAVANLEAAEGNVATAALNLTRQRTLYDKGLSAQRELELAVLAEVTARADRDSKAAQVTGAEGHVHSLEAEVSRARAVFEADRSSAEASLQSARAQVASADVELAQLAVKISRLRAQTVVAPRDGTILKLMANQDSELVKEGDPLAVIVPDAAQRAVELWVDGNDAALIGKGRKVRVQFEGWPAVQFSGWPSVAVGTFGGVVSFVDSTDDGHGDFRVVVAPDPQDEPWPSVHYLRQGVLSNGWVLLDRVTVGYEIWRRFNGFPPRFKKPLEDPDASTKPGRGASKGNESKTDTGEP
jgi:adhesin transport system membrane fusion protein